MTKCPYCEKLFSHVRMDSLEGRPSAIGNNIRYVCVSYSCPFCLKLLGIQMDPIAIKTDTVNAVAQRLGRL